MRHLHILRLRQCLRIDEEIGLLGAEGFDTSVLKGKYLINLDSEAEGYLWSGCAGGLRSYSELPVKRVEGTGLSCKIIVGWTGLRSFRLRD